MGWADRASGAAGALVHVQRRAVRDRWRRWRRWRRKGRHPRAREAHKHGRVRVREAIARARSDGTRGGRKVHAANPGAVGSQSTRGARRVRKVLHVRWCCIAMEPRRLPQAIWDACGGRHESIIGSAPDAIVTIWVQCHVRRRHLAGGETERPAEPAGLQRSAEMLDHE